MIFLMTSVICASMAVDASCHTADPKASTTFLTREACENMVYTYNNAQFQKTEEELDAGGKPVKTWTYYCRAVTEPKG